MMPSPDTLARAFAAFNQRSVALEASYGTLARRVQRLDADLSSANRRLGRSLSRARRMRRTMRDLLANLDCGVAVLSGAGRLRFANEQALRLARLERDRGGEGPLQATVTELAASGGRREIGLRGPGGVERRIDIEVSRSGEPGEEDLLVLMDDVTERRRLEEAESRSSRLEAMGRMAAEIAHEVRNPLGSVELFAGLLAEELKGDEERAEMADMVLLGARSIAAVIRNMLTFTRSFPPLHGVADLAAVVRDSVRLTAAAARARQVDLRQRARPAPPIAGDAELLRQVVLNLVQNALEACSEGGRVWLHILPLAGGAALVVGDSGCGMGAAEVSRIFDPFYTSRSGGTGLGLAVVHRLVEHHGGTLEVRSRPGKGSRFVVRFPGLRERRT